MFFELGTCEVSKIEKSKNRKEEKDHQKTEKEPPKIIFNFQFLIVRAGDWPVLSQSCGFHGLIRLGSRDGRLKGLSTFIIRLDTRVRRLGTSGL